jgi:tryptophan synthase beta chain
MAPTLSSLYDAGYIDAVALPQVRAFQSGQLFAKTEGILPAPESNHAICAAIDEALDAKAKGEKRVILFNLSGHGHFDLSAYEAYMQDNLQDFACSEEYIQSIPSRIPAVDMEKLAV